MFDGRPITQEDVEKIGYLPEERGLYRKMTVGDQAMYLAQLKGMSSKEAKAELMQWFKRFGIESWWNKKVEELSKGMAQKVQFITTVVHKPSLLILDEPFSGFDPVNDQRRDPPSEGRGRDYHPFYSQHGVCGGALRQHRAFQ